LGCGLGAISLHLAQSSKINIIGIDSASSAIDDATIELQMIKSSIRGTVRFIAMDLNDAPQKLGRNFFDLVICNPPFFKRDAGRSSPQYDRQIARQETTTSLLQIIAVASSLLKDGGRFFGILPPDRLSELTVNLSSQKMSLSVLCPVFTKAHSPARRVLFQAIKSRQSGLSILPGLQAFPFTSSK
jgi:tRNA1(Val) A37 N6-methylase TrmN6